MDERLKKKIFMFQLAAWINLALGIYVLIAGPGFLPQGTVFWLSLFFFAFAALDFWFPTMLKRRWEEMLAKHREQERASATQAKPAAAAGEREGGKS